MFQVNFGEGSTITRLVALISQQRLVVVVVIFNREGYSEILNWDWQNGRIMPVSLPKSSLKKWNYLFIRRSQGSLGLCVTEAQMIDDYRILWIAGPAEQKSLVLSDTSVPQTRQLVLEMPVNKLDVVYTPQRLMGSRSAQGGIGLHRADKNHRIIGMFCQGSYGDVPLDGYYMMIVSTGDLCAHALTQSEGELKISWERWKSSATIVKIDLGITTVACTLGSRFFAVVKGVSYTAYAILLRVYDFSPGARGRRHPNRPPVRNLIVNAGHVLKKIDNAAWDFSEDNLLMFNVSSG